MAVYLTRVRVAVVPHGAGLVGQAGARLNRCSVVWRGAVWRVRRPGGGAPRCSYGLNTVGLLVIHCVLGACSEKSTTARVCEALIAGWSTERDGVVASVDRPVITRSRDQLLPEPADG